jgi:hypothetical protein
MRDIEEETVSVGELVFQALGQASMCWDPPPDGAFDSTKAIDVGHRLIADLKLNYNDRLPKG